MNKKEIIEHLKQNMPNFQGKQEEIEAKTALYIYIELGKMKSFDEKYYFGNSKTRRKIYRLAERQENNVDAIANQRKIICVTLTYLYCSILREFGIHVITSAPEEGGHIYPIITVNDKNVFVADLQCDLENIQTKSRLKHFGYNVETPINRLDSTNQDTLTEMLIEIGYITSEADYKDEEIEILAKKVKCMNPHEALKTILDDEKLYYGNEDMESVEINKFYKRILGKSVPTFFERRIFAFNCYREKEDGQRDYTLCTFSEEDTIKPYLFSKKDKKFVSVEISKIRELEEEGLKIGANSKENGVKKLKKYMDIQLQKEKEIIESNQKNKTKIR
jgi:hypothetical protein